MPFSIALDHLVIAARSLEEGRTYVEAVLGVDLSPGGEHPLMGTHNMLIALGRQLYLEVIAINPDMASPSHRRWFNLDAFDAAPRLTNWVCRTDDLETALAAAPPGSGKISEQFRGDLSWRFAVPEFGRLPFDDAMPALMQWDSNLHPCGRLPETDLRLSRLDVFHPRSDDLLDAFPALHQVDHVSVRDGPEKRLVATISTPEGNRILA